MERARLGTMRRGRRKGDGRLTGKRHLRLFLSSPADERDPWVKEQGHAVRRRVLRTRDAGKEAGLCTRTYGLRARRVAARGKQLGRSCWAAWPKASGLAGQAGPWPEERSGELGLLAPVQEKENEGEKRECWAGQGVRGEKREGNIFSNLCLNGFEFGFEKNSPHLEKGFQGEI